jgi:hypothetical protein
MLFKAQPEGRASFQQLACVVMWLFTGPDADGDGIGTGKQSPVTTARRP